MKYLSQHNALPWVALGIAFILIYFLMEANIVARMERDKAIATSHQANETMGLVMDYTESRFDALDKLKKEDWEEGKHAKTISYNGD